MSRDSDPEIRAYLEIWDAIESRRSDAIRRVFKRYPHHLNDDTPTSGCHIHRAARYGGLAVVRQMVELGADPDLKDGRDGTSPLSDACASAQLDVVEYLLALGVEIDVSTSRRNPLFSCICSSLPRMAHSVAAGPAGFATPEDALDALDNCASLLISAGIDLTAVYIQPTMVDMDATAFAFMFGATNIAEATLNALYCGHATLAASARAEALEVAMGNAFSREKFRRWRYPPTRGKNKDWRPPEGEYWQ